MSQESSRPRIGLWPTIPETALDREVPPRFRGLAVRFRDPDRVLVEFIDWLERGGSSSAVPPGAGDGDRRALIDGCVDVLDRVSNRALEQRLLSCLSEAGVEALNVEGEPFDPNKHNAIHRIETADPRLHNTIASTERVGLVDRGRVVRRADVSVYRSDRA